MSIIHYNFRSKVLSFTTNLTITLPEVTRLNGNKGLDEIYRRGMRFPTLYLLHGGGSDSTSWVRNTRVEAYASERGLMTVSVDAQESFYCDMVHGPAYFTYLSEELPRVVRTFFPSSGKREETFVAGFSMGAHGAMKWALRRPDTFAAVIAMSGAKDMVKMMKLAQKLGIKATDKTVLDAFGPVENIYGSENDLLYLAKTLAQSEKQAPMIYTACGTEDYGYMLCREYKDYLDQVGLKNEFISAPGAHEHDFSDRMIKKAIFELFPL